MPDPTQDLADIIEPVIPLAASAAHDWLLPAGAALVGITVAIGLYWQWRRRAPLRALHRLRHRTDPQRAAGELAALLSRFKHSPDPLWREELQRLRFGPPQDDAQALFDRLCREAATLLQRRP